jgi:hypothetical protein
MMAKAMHYFVHYGLYYGIFAGLFLCYAIILYRLLEIRQWKLVILCLAFTFIPLIRGGFLIALIIGWQEAKRAQIKNVMRIYSVLLVPCFFVWSSEWVDYLLHPPKEEPVAKGKLRPKGKPVLKPGMPR